MLKKKTPIHGAAQHSTSQHKKWTANLHISPYQQLPSLWCGGRGGMRGHENTRGLTPMYLKSTYEASKPKADRKTRPN